MHSCNSILVLKHHRFSANLRPILTWPPTHHHLRNRHKSLYCFRRHCPAVDFPRFFTLPLVLPHSKVVCPPPAGRIRLSAILSIVMCCRMSCRVLTTTVWRHKLTTYFEYYYNQFIFTSSSSRVPLPWSRGCLKAGWSTGFGFEKTLLVGGLVAGVTLESCALMQIFHGRVKSVNDNCVGCDGDERQLNWHCVFCWTSSFFFLNLMWASTIIGWLLEF